MEIQDSNIDRLGYLNFFCTLTFIFFVYVYFKYLAYLMLSAAITNAVCLNNASFSFLFSLICANDFYLHAFSLLISFFC